MAGLFVFAVLVISILVLAGKFDDCWTVESDLDDITIIIGGKRNENNDME